MLKNPYIVRIYSGFYRMNISFVNGLTDNTYHLVIENDYQHAIMYE